MTNEELADAIQGGRTELYADLWENVRRFVAKMAALRYEHVKDRRAIDIDDLTQSGYLALVAAVEGYDPGKGSFLTYLGFRLQTAFSDACGRRTEREAQDPIHKADSLDAPIDDDDPDGLTLLDLQQGTEDVETTATEAVFREELRAAIEKLFSKMSPKAADVLRSKYLTGEPVEKTAERYGLTVKGLAARRSGYWNELRVKARTTPEGRELWRFIEDGTDYYTVVGPDQFNRTHTSAVEKLVMQREDLMFKYYRERGR